MQRSVQRHKRGNSQLAHTIVNTEQQLEATYCKRSLNASQPDKPTPVTVKKQAAQLAPGSTVKIDKRFRQKEAAKGEPSEAGRAANPHLSSSAV